MFRKELLSFLLATENNAELDEYYLVNFEDIHINNPDYEMGYSMLIDCCEVWIKYPHFTWEIIMIMSNIRNIISTNTFPDIFIDNKQKILDIYSDTGDRVRAIHREIHGDENFTNLEKNIADERSMFRELFENSNIEWFD